MSELFLKIGSQEFAGWQEVEITRSLDAVVQSFSLTVTEQWSELEDPKPIQPGDACEIYVDSELLLTGYIDDVDPDYDATSHRLTVTGRSKLMDLNDCQLDSRSWKGEYSLEEIAADICLPFGIKVLQTVSGLAKLKDQQLEYGQTALEFLDELAKIRGVRLFGNAQGQLVIGRTSTVRIETPLILGENIKRGSGNFSSEQRFSKYTVKSSTAGGNSAFGNATKAEVSAEDIEVTRYRPFFTQTEIPGSIGDCEARANWTRNSRIGRSLPLNYVVQNWRHESGIWDFNKIVTVTDKYMRMEQTDLLISSVSLSKSTSGELVTLKVSPPEAFAMEPQVIVAEKAGF